MNIVINYIVYGAKIHQGVGAKIHQELGIKIHQG